MSIPRQEWADWLRSSVTQAVLANLKQKRAQARADLEQVQGETVEQMGMNHLAIRNVLVGLDALFDLIADVNNELENPEAEVVEIYED